MTARGIRNNNPGNIDFNPRNKWQGQLGMEEGGRFSIFDEPENGIRAMGKLILNYRGKDGMPGVGAPGIDTVREIISRWAPGNENNTEAYIQAVAKSMRVKAEDPLMLQSRLIMKPLLVAIIAHENGHLPYSDAIIDEGVSRALRG